MLVITGASLIPVIWIWTWLLLVRFDASFAVKLIVVLPLKSVNEVMFTLPLVMVTAILLPPSDAKKSESLLKSVKSCVRLMESLKLPSAMLRLLIVAATGSQFWMVSCFDSETELWFLLKSTLVSIV